MGKQIPRSLEFIKNSLYDGEVERWLGWYNHLANPDKRNVGRFLRKSYDWMLNEAENMRLLREQWQKEIRLCGREPDEEFLKGDYFIAAAIGSSLTGTQYNDVDILVITNRIWRDMGSFESVLLKEILSEYFEYAIDPTVSEAYNQVWGRPARTLVTLNPIQGNGKSIHVTVQPEIKNEECWQKNDKEPSVVLYRMGDVTGYHDRDTELVRLISEVMNPVISPIHFQNEC